MGNRPVVKPDWRTRTLKERFDAMWMPEPFSGCWLWTRAWTLHGYGRLSYKLKPVTAHRLSWLITHGEMPPDNLLVCHKCDTKCCVNPDHLFLGTWSDNLRDAIQKGIHKYEKTFVSHWPQRHLLNKSLKTGTCKHGHPWEQFLYIHDGQRFCQECARLSASKARERNGKPPVFAP